MLKPPIFLIGNYRSGTSLVQKITGLHPDIVTWYEPRTLWLCANPRQRDDEFDESAATEKVIRYIRKRFLSYQQRHGNRRVMEKTPANILKVPYVTTIFPEAYYLYMTRHPFSVLSSMELKWQKTKSLKGMRRSLEATPPAQLPLYAGQYVRDFLRKKVLGLRYSSMYGPRYRGIEKDLQEHDMLTVIARQWAIGNRKARLDLTRLLNGRVFQFRYEDLMEQPQDLVRKIYDHCELKYDPAIACVAEKMVDPGRQKKWRRFEREQIEAILPEIRAEMEICGYEVPPLD